MLFETQQMEEEVERVHPETTNVRGRDPVLYQVHKGISEEGDLLASGR